jgi:hypothetical protein
VRLMATPLGLVSVSTGNPRDRPDHSGP